MYSAIVITTYPNRVSEHDIACASGTSRADDRAREKGEKTGVRNPIHSIDITCRSCMSTQEIAERVSIVRWALFGEFYSHRELRSELYLRSRPWLPGRGSRDD
jgi:hypothetical protein